MIVLGVDPGTANTGYGLIARDGNRLRSLDYGHLETLAGRPLAERLLTIHQGIGELIDEHAPDLVGVESLFFNRNVQSAFAVGQARGVVLLAAAQRGIPVVEFNPNEVKVAVTGYGRADKGQVQRMVQALLGLAVLPRPDHAADALAIAVWAANTRGTAGATAAVLDRAAIAPIERGLSGYERSVREALVREKAAEREAKRAAKRGCQSGQGGVPLYRNRYHDGDGYRYRG